MSSEKDGAVFERQRINFTPPDVIEKMGASGGVLALGLAKGGVLRIPLASPEGQLQLESPFGAGDKLALLSQDPTGQHLLLSSAMGENFYFHPSLRPARLKALPKLKGNVLTAVAWNRALGSDAATAFIVLGTSRGTLFETSLDSTGSMAYLRQLHSLSEDAKHRVPVGALRLERCEGDRWALWAATPGQLFPFLGPVTQTTNWVGSETPALPALFESPGRSQNLDPSPGAGAPCGLTQWAPSPDAPAAKLAWLASPGVLHGSMDPGTDDPFRLSMEEQLYQHPEVNGRAEWPLEAVATEHHLLLLYANRLVGLSSLTEEVAYEDVLGSKFGKVCGMVRDASSGLVWVWCERSVLKYRPVREGRYVWRAHLARGEFSLARRYATEAGRREDLREVLEQEAAHLLRSHKPSAAAEMLALSGAPFEPSALKLLAAHHRPALRLFLEKRFATLRPMDKTEATMLVLWLLELHLTELQEAKSGVAPPKAPVQAQSSITSAANPFGDDEEEEDSHPTPSSGFDHTKYRRLREQLHSFLKDPRHLEYLKTSPEAVYQVMTSHGDLESLRFFAQMMGESKLVLRLLVQEGHFEEALKVLKAEGEAALFHEFSAKLVQGGPQLVPRLAEAWEAQGPRLAPKLLLPAMFQADQSPEAAKVWMKYLEFCVGKLGSTEAAVHNYLVSLYARFGEGERLLAYVRSQGREQAGLAYDVKYALRLCRERGLHEAGAEVLCVLGLWEEATALALESADFALAKRIAALPAAAETGGEELQKRLWLRIGQALVKEGGEMDEAMGLLSQSAGLLKIQDILPFFPRFATIQHFKESLCECLADHSSRIGELEKDMGEASEVSEEIRKELGQLKRRARQLRPSDACGAECGEALLAKPFYAFPCRHAFHSDCVQRELAPSLSSDQLSRLTALKHQLISRASAAEPPRDAGGESGASKGGWALPGRSFLPSQLLGRSEESEAGRSTAAEASEERASEEELWREMDEVLGGQCPWCGDPMLRRVHKNFFTPKEYAKQLQSWQVTK